MLVTITVAGSVSLEVEKFVRHSPRPEFDQPDMAFVEVRILLEQLRVE